jgi:DNA-binding LacI/PurR family transcriptional regulator
MDGALVCNTKLLGLASRIEGDIRSRGLRSGDRYHTSGDVAQMLGVSTATAHRAMDLLVQKDLLTRQHGRGTFVGSAIGSSRAVKVRTIYIFIEEHQRELTSVPLETMIQSVRGEFPQINVQFCFIPAGSGLEYVRQIVEPAMNAGQFAGAIPISCSREVYRYLSETGAPVVVLGSLYPDQWMLPSVDFDYRESGRLLAEYLARRGHQRIALFTTGGGRPGDDAMYDGVSEALTAARLSPSALAMRVYPQDAEAFHAQTTRLLLRLDRPTGIICASERLLGLVASCMKELDLSVPDDVEIVFESQGTSGAASLKYPFVRAKLSFPEVARLVAGMLKKLSNEEIIDPRQIVIPVELCDPSYQSKVPVLR